MRVGILGAGQLGRMLALAGYPLGLDFVFLDPSPEACAAALGTHIRADYLDEAALARFCGQIDVATYEFENVPAAAAEFVAARVPFRPGSRALIAAQDRLDEKRLFEQLGIPVPRYAAVDTLEQLRQAVADLGTPAILKTRRLGYDGKGQFRLRSPDDCESAWQTLGRNPGGGELILESFVRFERELSCLGVRGHDGGLVFYPVVENRHHDGILRLSRPRAADPLQAEAERHVARVMEHLGYVGVLAFEFFVAGGRLLANEIAPRVHNSGHWTIEGAETSQFENHLRAVTGSPLGRTRLREHSLMINFIGDLPPAGDLTGTAGLHPHIYGKAPKPLRKVGHATLLAASDQALDQAFANLPFKDSIFN